jgi:hypothetical protein
MSCKDCAYSGNCYQEKCYTTLEMVCEDFEAKTDEEDTK